MNRSITNYARDFSSKSLRPQYSLKAGTEEEHDKRFEGLFLELDYLLMESISTNFCQTVRAFMQISLQVRSWRDSYKAILYKDQERFYKEKEDLKSQITKLEAENQRLNKELEILTDPYTMYVDHDLWLETQRKLKKLYFLWKWL